ncbi:DUF5695 domain-containing protein [Mucilaginibacter polytrichastri]|uniref:Uncharacterized protein n=1 Tax=Mucilaginibacter polytrichastri TaxID=1302689 RepID=A0A1Q5ZZU2_9SPHI|nr:DUF5695 domain-containing protein [Mucilaginibacter polytrichastri]OKS87262.1 hypothetical protein RG47T_2721 [Mucilaginibacter polytrichastri]SFT18665.1 hypothetical protein SAMN04487890_11539 [Mucilaginibacter polytrichastri]
MRYLYTRLFVFTTFCIAGQFVFARQIKPAVDTVSLQKINPYFNLDFNGAGLSSIKKPGDHFPTDYISKGRAFGEFTLKYKTGKQDAWSVVNTANLLHLQNSSARGVAYNAADNNADIKLSNSFTLSGDAIIYQLNITNLSNAKLQVGSLSLPLNYNNLSGENPKQIFEERVMKHHFISGDGSYVFWERPTGLGPYLVMTPLPGTHLEYDDLAKNDSDENVFRMFIHSKAEAENVAGTWRQPQTVGEVSAKSSVTYGFKFRWAKDYQGVRDILYQEGLPDINIIPGMTVPDDLFALFSIRCRQKINAIESEFPADTKLIDQGTKPDGTHLYKVQFSHHGENRLTINYGKGLKTYLEFFSTEPLATLYQKRASFITSHQQHKVPGKWYDGVFSQWDMCNQVLRGPDNSDGFDGWWSYVLTCDDPGLCKAPFLAAKNMHYPDQKQIDALEYYIKNFVWGKLQRTDQEKPYPYGVYGTPSWYVDRDPEKRKLVTTQNLDKEHIWRSYDYPHIMMLYFHMYQIASMYPDKTHYLDKTGYLIRAKETAKAFFKYPYEIMPWYETYKWGCYNELLLVDLIAALKKEGYPQDAEWLQKEWEKKVKYFIYDDKYPYRSEYSIDATAFESSHAFAKYAIANTMQPDSNLWYDKKLKKWYSHPHVTKQDAVDFMQKQMQANIACRGWLENAYYLKGSDFRGSSDGYLLSYMAQMGGWAIVDYALNYTNDAAKYLQLGYASYLSSFALMNTGTAKSNYGYWYPGKENDGASGWAFEPMRHSTTWIRKEQDRGAWFYDGEIDLGYSGALRTASTIVTTDPVFGLFAYGGLVNKIGDQYAVSPKDGLQQRFYYRNKGRKLDVELNRDGFANNKSIIFNKQLTGLTLHLQNRTGDVHTEKITVSGLSQGKYNVQVDGKVNGIITIVNDQPSVLSVAVNKNSGTVKLIKK